MAIGPEDSDVREQEVRATSVSKLPSKHPDTRLHWAMAGLRAGQRCAYPRDNGACAAWSSCSLRSYIGTAPDCPPWSVSMPGSREGQGQAASSASYRCGRDIALRGLVRWEGFRVPCGVVLSSLACSLIDLDIQRQAPMAVPRHRQPTGRDGQASAPGASARQLQIWRQNKQGTQGKVSSFPAISNFLPATLIRSLILLRSCPATAA